MTNPNPKVPGYYIGKDGLRKWGLFYFDGKMWTVRINDNGAEIWNTVDLCDWVPFPIKLENVSMIVCGLARDMREAEND